MCILFSSSRENEIRSLNSKTSPSYSTSGTARVGSDLPCPTEWGGATKRPTTLTYLQEWHKSRGRRRRELYNTNKRPSNAKDWDQKEWTKQQ